MALESASSEMILSGVSHRPHYILRGMISVPGLPKPSAIDRDPGLSSLGHLDNIPLELLHLIFEMLDFQSLSRVSRTSLRGKAVIESLPAYRDLMEHAAHLFNALGQTRSLPLHSAGTLYRVLTSEKCHSCGSYGAFLFLPTCTRCCYECLHRNPSLWVIPKALARKSFGLLAHQLSGVPTMRSVPGNYSVGHRISRRRPLRLISVKAAKELAIEIHGSVERMATDLAARCGVDITQKEFLIYKWLQNAPLEPLGHDPCSVKTQEHFPNDECCGMASIPFPSLLNDKSLEEGLWCRGCEMTFERFRFQELSPDVVSSLAPPRSDPYDFLHGMQRRARTKSEFLEHVKHCHCAREVFARSWEGLK